MTQMTPALRLTLQITDIAMLLYWSLSAMFLLGVHPPAGFMYQGYGTPLIDAWNWSFAPLDLAFSLSGLFAVRMARRQDERWRHWALISLSLTFCAGLMAISFWVLTGDYTVSWWIPNLMLAAIALFWIPRLIGPQQ
jgi:Family of unknown function (DUF5360)